MELLLTYLHAGMGKLRFNEVHATLKSHLFLVVLVLGCSCQKWANSEKKVSFDFAAALYSIDAPDIPKNFAK